MTNRVFLSICGFCAATGACAESDGGAAATPAEADDELVVLATPAEACNALAGRTVPATSIGLPTRGAAVTRVTLVAGTATAPEYCKVEGAIDSVDPFAPDIRFQLNLPSQWNQKALHYGGFGLGGFLITGLDNVPAAPIGGATPLARGYATFGSDSGHASFNPIDGSFAFNDEALTNFASAQLKKTHDVARALIQARYAAAPARMYFAGGSQGGHEALTVVQRWPADYDGAVVHSPASAFTMVMLAGNQVSKALYAPGAFLNPNKIATLSASVLAACDTLDGVQDGVVSDVKSCNGAYDVEDHRCPGGADTGNTCFSNAQIAALDAMNSPLRLTFPLQAGLTEHAKWPIYEGAEINGLFSFGVSPFAFHPPAPVNAGLYALTDAFIVNFVTRNPFFDSLQFQPTAWRNRLMALSNLLDINSPNLTGFKNRGGKVLIVHGTGDFAVSVYSVNAYYDRLVNTFGQSQLDSFLRYYVIPGYGHGNGTFTATWDSVTALESWVEAGNAPTQLVATDANPATTGRTRPMCPYPTWPRYVGSNPNAAASFTCVAK